MKSLSYLLSSILLLICVCVINVFIIGREGDEAIIATLGSFTIAILLRDLVLGITLK